MSHTVLRAPRTHARLGGRKGDRPISSITIGLSESSASGIAWRVRVDVIFSGGRSRLGTILTAPPSSKRLGTRVVAICCAPGVLTWDVVAAPVRPYSAKDVGGTLKVDGCDYTGELGIVPLDGSLLLAGGPAAGAYNHDAGTAPGTATIPVGASVESYSAVASSVGPVTIQITAPIFGALPVITVPTGGAFADNPESLVGPATIAFAGNVASWAAAWRELA